MVVLAFNQKNYIEDAIEGALLQNYANLEIVLSDDCSSDSTYDIMENVARKYRGPHRIVVNRTPQNAGILNHFYHAVAKSSGRLIVVAAGDDISLPVRVSTLVGHWQATGAAALSSDWFVMDDKGIVTGTRTCAADGNTEGRWFADGRFTRICGATAAYDRSVFEEIALPDLGIMAEDYFFGLILHLRSMKIIQVAVPLVKYRSHAQSVINRPLVHGNILREERRLEVYWAMIARMFDYLVELARTGVGVKPDFGKPADLRWQAIHAQMRDVRFRARWIDAPVWQRLVTLARPPFNKVKFRWYGPRLGGIATLRLQRWLSAAYRSLR